MTSLRISRIASSRSTKDTIVDFKPQALPVVRFLQQPHGPAPSQAFGAANFVIAIVGFVENLNRELAPNEVPQVCFDP